MEECEERGREQRTQPLSGWKTSVLTTLSWWIYIISCELLKESLLTQRLGNTKFECQQNDYLHFEGLITHELSKRKTFFCSFLENGILLCISFN